MLGWTMRGASTEKSLGWTPISTRSARRRSSGVRAVTEYCSAICWVRSGWSITPISPGLRNPARSIPSRMLLPILPTPTIANLIHMSLMAL